MKYDLIIFDCDGVIVDSEPIANRIFAKLLHELGYSLTYAECEKMFTGRSDKDCLALLEEKTCMAPQKDLFEIFDERAFKAYEKELKTVEGIEEIISLLNFDDFCVATNAPEKKIYKTLGITGLLPKFKGKIFSSSMVERPKPFPDLFLYAAKKMNAVPEKCVVIEDSPYGVSAAVSAGMDVLGYCKRTDKKILKNAGAITFNRMSDLKTLLGLN